MLKFKNVSMKNFLSVGAVTQSISLIENGLTLVLGDNIDLGSNGSRNGVGKTTILHAISYALYGIPMTNIKKDNLINKANVKNMIVILEFEKDNHNYRIERGRKPAHFKFLVDNNLVNNSDTNEAQGDEKTTQEEIVRILGLSHLLFKHLITLSTKTLPFLNEKAQTQREMIEELLGITQLSEKAEVLKELIKHSKTEIERDEFRIQVLKEQNEKALLSIKNLNQKSESWETHHLSNISRFETEINKLMQVDVELEINNHKTVQKIKDLQGNISNLKTNKRNEEKLYENLNNQIEKVQTDYESLLNHKCHACGQDIHDHKHTEMINNITTQLEELCEKSLEQETLIEKTVSQLNPLLLDIETYGNPPATYYSNIHDAYDHKNNLDTLISKLETEVDTENLFVEQIKTLKTDNMQEVSYDYLNELTKIKEHQEFLFKLLTDKKSWVRMQIIERNLGYLNNRLDYYLRKLELPHQVRFLGDLNVEIIKLGQSFDFDNLSTGESTRLVLGLSWAFRDIFEVLNYHINLLIIDELIDAGMDLSGGESALAVLKKMTRELNKNVFLISHKDDFIARVSNVLMVNKENNFTSYEYETDIQLS